MRPIRTAAVALALAAALTACSGSSGKGTDAAGSGGTTATTDGPATVATTTVTSAAGAAASTGTATSGECATLVEAITEMSGTWQIYVQLASIPDVAEWKKIIEPMGLKHTFTETLDTLSKTFGGDKDAADAITYMRTADGFVQQGLSGDTTAVAALKSHIGVNVMEALLKQAPLSKAFGAKGC